MNNLNETKRIAKTVKDNSFFEKFRKECELYEAVLIVILFIIIGSIAIILICIPNHKDYPIALNAKEHEYISISQKEPIQITNENIIKIYNIDSDIIYIISKDGVEEMRSSS